MYLSIYAVWGLDFPLFVLGVEYGHVVKFILFVLELITYLDGFALFSSCEFLPCSLVFLSSNENDKCCLI